MCVKCHTVVCRGIRGEAENHSKRSSRTFDIDRLFEAVASRDVAQLDGLDQYLHRSMKKLSDSLCERGTSSHPCNYHSGRQRPALTVPSHSQISPMARPP